MKRLLCVSILVLFAGAVWSEDLGELAKKEKARREALKKQGKKATVLTNADVKSIKSSLAIETNSPVYEVAPDQPGPSEPEAAIDEAIDESSARLEELRQQKAELTREIQDSSDSIQQSGAHSSNIGDQYREKRLKEEELKKVEAEIEELEKGNNEIPETEEENN